MLIQKVTHFQFLKDEEKSTEGKMKLAQVYYPEITQFYHELIFWHSCLHLPNLDLISKSLNFTVFPLR
jgi:hypothetical protein